jgi:hypothetical protein
MNSKFIGYVAGCWYRQANENVGAVRTAGHQKKHQASLLVSVY